MEVVKSQKSGVLDGPSVARIDLVAVDIFKPDVMSMLRQNLGPAAGSSPRPGPASRPGPSSRPEPASRPGPASRTRPASRTASRPASRAQLDRNAVEVVEPDAPDVAVVVLGGDARLDVTLGSPPPPLDESSPVAPKHVAELPSEEDVGVETRPDDMNPLTDHNYEVNVKMETDEMLSDVDDDEPPKFLASTVVKMEMDGEDEDVDVELDDDVQCILDTTPEPRVPTPDVTIKSEPTSSPGSASVTSEVAPSPAAPARPNPLRPGWRECPICGEAVMGVMGYRDHMLARHMHAQPYRCLACFKRFSLAKDLIRHTNNNCAEVFYKCQRCDRTWSSDRHHASCEWCAAAGGDVPVEDKDSVYECSVCARTFPLLRHLTAHVKTHPDGGKMFKCHTCGQRFSQSVRLMIHIRSHVLSPSKKKSPATPRHRAAPASSAAPGPATPKSSFPAKRGRPCGSGGAGASTSNSTPRSALALSYANPAFILKMEPPEPHSDVEFAELSAAFDDDDYHDDIFKGAVGFDDDDDDDDDDDGDYDDDDEDDVDDHEDQDMMMEKMMGGVDAGDASPASWKRYKCKWCTRTFRFSHQVGIHMRTHTGERPYCCRLCDQQFVQSNHLKRHLYGNHGLTGPLANQAFRSMIALKKRRQQRERFRALTAFFAKQGGFKGFAEGAEEVAGVDMDTIINRGFDKDLSGRGKAGKKARDEHQQRIGNPGKPWVNLSKVNGAGGPGGPGPAPADSAAAPAANGTPATGNRPDTNGMQS